MISTALTRIRHLAWNSAPLVVNRNIRFHPPVFPMHPLSLQGRIRRFGNWPPEATQYVDSPHKPNPVKLTYSWTDFIGDEPKAKELLTELKKTTPVVDLIIRFEGINATKTVSFDSRKIQAAAKIALCQNQGIKECRISGIVLSKNGATNQLAELISSLSHASFEINIAN